jgi:RNA polymerase sigma factor (sigma-70 family)
LEGFSASAPCVFTGISPGGSFCYPLFVNFFFELYLAPKSFTISTVIHTDQRYVQALLDNDTLAVREIYEKYAGKVRYYILANSGTGDDAADIFQEALVDIYNQAKQKGLQLTCPFEPFVILVCKRKWLNELKKRGRQPVTKEVDDVSIGEDVFALAEQLKLNNDKMQLFLQCFEKLGASCKEIIQKCLSGEDQEKIAEQLKVTYGYLRKKKSECMASLTQMIQTRIVTL